MALPFLSEAWIDGLADAARDAPVVDLPGRFVVEVTVVGEPVVTWHLVVDEGRLTVGRGPAADAALRLRADPATAAALARGSLNAQHALSHEQLHLDGDLTDVARGRAALEALGDVFGAVRAGTDFDPD